MDFEDIPKFVEDAREAPYYVLFFTAQCTEMRLGELLGVSGVMYTLIRGLYSWFRCFMSVVAFAGW